MDFFSADFIDRVGGPFWAVMLLLTFPAIFAVIAVVGKFLRGEGRQIDYSSRWRWYGQVSDYYPGKDDLDESERARLRLEANRQCGCRVCRQVLAEAGEPLPENPIT